ncbi:MAG: NUDIX domain-containing protein [Deltaproteobacteria bacterium]|nr:NUDIX domain-containing protein [Deltaproteobacteria bacterium]
MEIISSDAKPAATLILVKPHGNAFKVYLLKRSLKSRFMPGVHVFPGGMVDLEDRDLAAWVDHLDMTPGDMQQKLGAEGLEVKDTLSFVMAAIRETFEEAGVLLVNEKENRGPDLESLLKKRDGGHLEPGWFKSFMTATGWMPAVSKLHRWSHWITPRLMRLRFDTRFFLALMPENQVCRPDRKETTEGRWVTPKEGLTGNLSGEIPLSPPAVVTLHDLLAYPYMDDLMKAGSKRPWGDIIEPQLVPMEQGAMIIEPWDPMYGRDHIQIEEATLENHVLDPEVPFSRLWNDGRLWRPVRVQKHH